MFKTVKSAGASLDRFVIWKTLYQNLPDCTKSSFFSPAYYKSYQSLDKASIDLFWMYEDDGNFLFYSFYYNNIQALGYDLDPCWYDISGAYGYGGPIGVVTDADFTQRFNNKLKEHFAEKNVVTEFIRYCPLTENRQFHTYPQQIHVLDNVYIDLSKGEEHVWNESFEYRVRKTVRKGQSYGLVTKIIPGQDITEADWDIFDNIYESTMNRNEADEFYYFDRLFFNRLQENMGAKILLAFTYLESKAISTELVLLDGSLAYGFLGGTLGEYYDYKANTFQRWELVKHLCSLGFTRYSMGGGAQRGDSIYSFKMSFARGCENPFFIGTYVHNPVVYNDVLTQWKAKYPEASAKYAGKLQGYRHTS